MACDNLTPYVKTPWVNGTVPAINALHLNNIENGIGNVTICATEMKEALDSKTIPVGAIIMWNGGTVPAGWALCDGSGNTPNLVNRFIRGATASGATGGSDNAVVVSHDHSGKTNQGGEHSHTYDRSDNANNTALAPGADSIGFTSTNTSQHNGHDHVIPSDGESGTGKNIPAYYALMYIIKI